MGDKPKGLHINDILGAGERGRAGGYGVVDGLDIGQKGLGELPVGSRGLTERSWQRIL